MTNHQCVQAPRRLNAKLSEYAMLRRTGS
jgi:hypothetical protein